MNVLPFPTRQLSDVIEDALIEWAIRQALRAAFPRRRFYRPDPPNHEPAIMRRIRVKELAHV